MKTLIIPDIGPATARINATTSLGTPNHHIFHETNGQSILDPVNKLLKEIDNERHVFFDLTDPVTINRVQYRMTATVIVRTDPGVSWSGSPAMTPSAREKWEKNEFMNSTLADYAADILPELRRMARRKLIKNTRTRMIRLSENVKTILKELPNE